MKRLLVGDFPVGGMKLTNPNQVFHLNNINADSFYIIAEEVKIKNLGEFLEHYTDHRDLNVYSTRMPPKKIKSLFDKIIDKRVNSPNLFQVAGSMKNPTISEQKKFNKIQKAKTPARLIIKLMTKNTSSPQKAMLLAKADLYNRPEILTVLYTKR